MSHFSSVRDDHGRSTSHSQKVAGFVVSGVVHLLVVGSVLWWGQGEASVERPIIPPHVVRTKLVRLGKPRPKKLLPRLVKAPKAPPKEALSLSQELKPVDERKTKKELDKERKARERDDKDRRSAMDRILSKLKKDVDERGDEDSPEGRADGSVYGTETAGGLKAAWQDKVRASLYGMTSYSLLTADDLKRLKAKVFLEISAKGKILRWNFVKPSGSTKFDASVERTLTFFLEDGSMSLPAFPKDKSFGETIKVKVVFDPKGN